MVWLALAVLVLAGVLWWLGQRAQGGLPPGEVIYADTGDWQAVTRPLYSAHHDLTGKPDYIVQHGRHLIPIEVKSATSPAAGPHAAHIYQLAAYAVLVEATYGQRPPYGLIHYADQTWRVPFTPELERDLLAVLAAMRAAATRADVPRSHQVAARCAHCGLNHACNQALG